MAQMKEQIKNSRKGTKQNGDKQSVRCRVQNTGYKDAQRTQHLNSIKKIESETKATLIEIKNNLQGNNSRVDEAENQINDLEHKEAKNRKESKHRIVEAACGTT